MSLPSRTPRGTSPLACAVIATAMLLSTQPSAQAIVINDPAGAATAIALGTPHTAVVDISGLGTGSLIDPTHVLTAAHVGWFYGGVIGKNVQFHIDNDGIAEQEILIVARAELNTSGDVWDGTDLAILTLASAPIGVDPLPLYPGNPTGVVATTVGFGMNGLGSVGHEATRDGLRWAAENTIDLYGPAVFDDGPRPGSTNLFNADFDDGTSSNNALSGYGSSATMLVNEGTTGGGDSGGPLLWNGMIFGTCTSGTDFWSQYGCIGHSTGTYEYRDWILANAPLATFNSIPEPSTLAIWSLLGSLGIVGWWRKRKAA